MAFALDNDVFFAGLYEGHVAHQTARQWLDQIKPDGWAIAIETHLAALRLLMNPTILGKSVLNGKAALQAVNTELSGPHPGKILFAQDPPDPGLFDLATAHRQIMDFWLVQTARKHGYILMTRDQALNRTWPEFTCLLNG
jgi:predicted nucleic acid-binding protein